MMDRMPDLSISCVHVPTRNFFLYVPLEASNGFVLPIVLVVYHLYTLHYLLGLDTRFVPCGDIFFSLDLTPKFGKRPSGYPNLMDLSGKRPVQEERMTWLKVRDQIHLVYALHMLSATTDLK